MPALLNPPCNSSVDTRNPGGQGDESGYTPGTAPAVVRPSGSGSHYFATCPGCKRTVGVLRGRIVRHGLPENLRRFPKVPQTCAWSGERQGA